MKVELEPRKDYRASVPHVILINEARTKVEIIKVRPVPVKTKHPSLSLWNAKATMWGQG